LHDQFIPNLFMSHGSIALVLDSLFPAAPAPGGPIAVDFQVNSGTNSVNVARAEAVFVDILTSANFDARQVNLASVQFAGAAVRGSSVLDVDGDGDLDLRLEFRTSETNLLDLYVDAITRDLMDGILNSPIQAVTLRLTGTAALDAAFEGLEMVSLFL
jgi:hypothetical protein